LLDIPPQVDWFPSDFRFVLVALFVGAVVVFMAVKGFKKLAAFAEVCAPWMILMFIIGALFLLPALIESTPGITSISSFSDFYTIANESIWVRTSNEVGFWHVAAFAWVANLAMHGGMGDMTLLRFARYSRYGFFSALGMFIGHYMAWICAGIMGAGAAIILGTAITNLDPGAVAYQALGTCGIIAVIIAGWTTSNPTIYRAGLAFSSLNPKWSREKSTIVVGVVTTIIACFPFVFSQLLGFVGIMGLMMAPVGAIIVAEHWLFPRIGLTRYWSQYKGNNTNWAAIITWLTALALSYVLEQSGVLHLFFLLIPIWIYSTIVYCLLSISMGAKTRFPESEIAEAAETSRRQEEKTFLDGLSKSSTQVSKEKSTAVVAVASYIAIASLVACLVIGVMAFVNNGDSGLHTPLLIATIIYFITATYVYLANTKNSKSDSEPSTVANATQN
jgi:NCS1 family nucleobase:cation symporter-1